MPPNRPKKPPEPLQPRPVVDGARKAIQDPDPAIAGLVAEIRRQLLDPPESTAFEDGARAEKHLREHVCANGEEPLGPYIPVPRPDNTRTVGGRGMYALFPDWMLAWFERQNPESLAALDRVSRREIRGAILREVLRESWLWAGTAGAAVFAAVHWGVDTLAWINDRMPALKSLWQAMHKGITP